MCEPTLDHLSIVLPVWLDLGLDLASIWLNVFRFFLLKSYYFSLSNPLLPYMKVGEQVMTSHTPTPSSPPICKWSKESSFLEENNHLMRSWDLSRWWPASAHGAYQKVMSEVVAAWKEAIYRDRHVIIDGKNSLIGTHDLWDKDT